MRGGCTAIWGGLHRHSPVTPSHGPAPLPPVLQSLMNLLFVPPSIGEMPRLERLHLQQDYSEGMVVIELPRGPWLRSVRWLGLPWECLDDPDNLEVLRSTAQLEFLCALTLPCIGDREDSFVHWDAFFEWVATHPPLRCFGKPARLGTRLWHVHDCTLVAGRAGQC